jgi:lysyl-tRNA synthetase class 2
LIRKAGYPTVEGLKKASPGKLLNDLGGLRKKMKLDIPSLSIEQIRSWLLS